MDFTGSSSTLVGHEEAPRRPGGAVSSARAISISTPFPADRSSARPGVEEEVALHVHDEPAAARLDAKLAGVDERPESGCPKSWKSCVRASAAACALRSSSRRAFASSSAFDERPAIGEDLVDVLAEALELAAELLVDGRRLVELRLQVVARRRQLAQLGVPVLRGRLGGADLLAAASGSAAASSFCLASASAWAFAASATARS